MALAWIGALGFGAQSAAAARWSPMLLPAYSESSSAVACPSTHRCFSTGYTRWLRFNGVRWSTLPIPQPGTLEEFLGLACTAEDTCTAVGDQQGTPLIAHWNQSRWSLQRSPDPLPAVPPGYQEKSQLAAVACPSQRLCLAVGHSAYGVHGPPPAADVALGAPAVNHVLIERWNGRHWSIQRTQMEGTLTSVSCSSARSCIAAGSPTLRFNGRHWFRSRVPAGLTLDSVSCLRSGGCEAVGFTGSGLQTGLGAARWTGHRWRREPVSPVSTDHNSLQSVDCVSARFCIAVGMWQRDYLTPNTTAGPLVARWNGRRWRLTALAQPLDLQSPTWLQSVSCLSVQWCMAVGSGFADRYS